MKNMDDKLTQWVTIEGILSANLSASSLLKTINILAHTTARKHQLKHLGLATEDEKQAYIRAEHEFNVSLKLTSTMTLDGALKRLSEPRFWRKNIERQVLKAVERQAFTQKQLGHDKKEKCVSNKTLEYYDLKKEQLDCFLKSQELVSIESLKAGAESEVLKINLLDVTNSSKNSRINELFITLKSFEIIADQEKKDWVFLTFTCPPEYHPNPTTSAERYDPENDFSTAKEFLNRQFKSFLKYFDKKFKRGKDFFGIRVFEAHQDGCPHLHALMFFDPMMRKGIGDKMEWLHADTGQEKHFAKYKSDIVRFRSSAKRGAAKASSYIYKYLTSALNSEFEDLTAKRYKAAFRANSTRQYGFFGLKGSTTKRRALKKVISMDDVPRHLRSLAESLHVSKGTEGRLEKQLAASIDFIRGGHEMIELISESAKNEYGEEVRRVTEVKHTKDSHSVRLSGRYYRLTGIESQALDGESDFVRNITIKQILESVKEATISINYSSKTSFIVGHDISKISPGKDCILIGSRAAERRNLDSVATCSASCPLPVDMVLMMSSFLSFNIK